MYLYVYRQMTPYSVIVWQSNPYSLLKGIRMLLTVCCLQTSDLLFQEISPIFDADFLCIWRFYDVYVLKEPKKHKQVLTKPLLRCDNINE